MASKPAWYRPPINGVPQSGRAGVGPSTMFQSPAGLKQALGFANASQKMAIPRFGTQQAQNNSSQNATGLIGGSPDLSGLKAQMAANSKADKAGMENALRRYVISYGEMPDLASLGISSDAAGFLKGAINDQVMGLAKKNDEEGTSVRARLNAVTAYNQRMIPAVAAGKGTLFSGSTGMRYTEEGQRSKNEKFDTLNQLLGNIEGSVGGYMQAERDRAMQLAQMEMEAAWSAAQQNGDSNLGEPEDTTPAPPGTTTPSTGIINRKPPKFSFVPRGSKKRITGLVRPPSGTRGGGV